MNAIIDREVPIACVPTAIPAAHRAAHFELAERLFTGRALSRRTLPDGMAFELPSSEFEAIARFIGNERRCCPFIKFEFAIEAGATTFSLAMTGPSGTREVMEAELTPGRSCGCKGECE